MKRHRSAFAGTNVGDSRYTFPGLKGFGGLDSLAKMQFEGQETNYTKEFISEEERILDINWEVKKLIESLDNIPETKDETKA